MAETIRDIVTLALRAAGVTGLGQDPLPEDINLGYTLFSRMLAQWQVKRWLVPGLTDISAVADGSISNKIGPGHHYDAIRPDKINAAYFVQLNTQNPVVSYPLRPIFSREDYARLSLKTLNSFPGWFFYDGAYPDGNVFIWPVPSNLYEIHLVVKLPIKLTTDTTINNIGILNAGAGYPDGIYPDQELINITGSGNGATATITVVGGVVTNTLMTDNGSGYKVGDTLTVNLVSGGGYLISVNVVNIVNPSLDTEINLPDEYLEAIHYNLIIRLVADYQYEPNPVQGVLAKNALNVIKNANAQIPRLNIPWTKQTGFNIYAPDVYQ